MAYFKTLGAAAAGKHPFTEGQFATLAEHSNWLIGQLTPTDAVPVPNAQDPAALVRDQLFTILWDRYSLLGGAVASVAGVNGVQELVPPLGSRKGSKAKEPKAKPEGKPSQG